jgi:hypothetical protein
MSNQNPKLGKFLRALDWKMLIYLMAIWNILQTFAICYDHLVDFLFVWCIFSSFGIMHQEKSGNPENHDNTTRYHKTIKTLIRGTSWRVCRTVVSADWQTGAQGVVVQPPPVAQLGGRVEDASHVQNVQRRVVVLDAKGLH